MQRAFGGKYISKTKPLRLAVFQERVVKIF